MNGSVKMITKDMYSEFSIDISDSKFMFFIDGGFICENARNSEVHSHKFYEIIFALEGNTTVPVKNKVYKLEKGDMVILPPDEKHSVKADSGKGIVVVSFWSVKSCFEHVMHFKKFKGGAAFLRLLDYYYNNYKYKTELMYSCFYEIAALILEQSELANNEELDTITLENDNYRKYIIDNYFLNNYNKSPKLDDLSEQLNLSAVQIHRILQKVYGKSFRKIVASLRIENAKILLSETDMPVSEISFAVGYHVLHNFYTVFKDENNMTPLQYRKAFAKI